MHCALHCVRSLCAPGCQRQSCQTASSFVHNAGLSSISGMLGASANSSSSFSEGDDSLSGGGSGSQSRPSSGSKQKGRYDGGSRDQKHSRERRGGGGEGGGGGRQRVEMDTASGCDDDTGLPGTSRLSSSSFHTRTTQIGTPS
jgi:hypothetical protein